jgi:hypothetical protein
MVCQSIPPPQNLTAAYNGEGGREEGWMENPIRKNIGRNNEDETTKSLQAVVHGERHGHQIHGQPPYTPYVSH